MEKELPELNTVIRTFANEAEAHIAQAVLDASHLIDLKKSNVLSRAVSFKSGAEPAYVVEFSLRSGASS